MRPPVNQWPAMTANNKGILMFAQLMAEMLNVGTFESFRVYSLSTPSRLDEALSVIRDVKRKRVAAAALDPVLAEVIWSLLKDPVARELAQDEIKSLEAVSRSKLDDLRAHIKLLIKILEGKYKKELEAKLLKTFSDLNKQKEFRQAVGFYCSHLINLGYSKPYIANQVERIFFSRDFQRIGKSALTNFFKIFAGTKKHFVVHAGLTHDLGHHLKQFGFTILDVSKIPHNAIAAISQSQNASNHKTYLEFKSKNPDYDPYRALLRTDEILSSVRAITYLDPHGMECEWGDTMYVSPLRSTKGDAVTKIPLTFERTPTQITSGKRLKRIRGYTKRILENFDDNSTHRILGAIDTAALSRSSTSAENKLISLWSAVEALLSEPEGPRIVHYCEHLTPCIALRHARRQIIATYEEMAVSYRRKFFKIINQAQGDYVDSHSRFAATLLLSQNQQLKADLFNLCTANPLASHRLDKLCNDYKNPHEALRTIKDHEKRVEWQIHRIYRARNHFAHAGQVPPFIESLVINIAEYFRAAIATIVYRASQEDDASEIDQIVTEIKIEYEMYKKFFVHMQGSQSLTKNELDRLIR